MNSLADSQPTNSSRTPTTTTTKMMMLKKVRRKMRIVINQEQLGLTFLRIRKINSGARLKNQVVGIIIWARIVLWVQIMLLNRRCLKKLINNRFNPEKQEYYPRKKAQLNKRFKKDSMMRPRNSMTPRGSLRRGTMMKSKSPTKVFRSWLLMKRIRSSRSMATRS